MGLDDPKERTYYWSYTNLVTTGQLTLEGKTYQVSGKSWFDKQGGTYTLTKRWTNWEWFSLRFFDNEEIMLFSFPQDDYQDGTYIEKSGKYRRLNDYRHQPDRVHAGRWEQILLRLEGGPEEGERRAVHHRPEARRAAEPLLLRAAGGYQGS